MFKVIFGLLRMFIDIVIFGIGLALFLLIIFQIIRGAGKKQDVKNREDKKSDETVQTDDDVKNRELLSEVENGISKTSQADDQIPAAITEAKKSVLTRQEKELRQKQYKEEQKFNELFSKVAPLIKKAFEAKTVRLQKKEDGDVTKEYIVNRLVSEKISALLKSDVLSSVPDKISNEIWMSNAEYVEKFTGNEETFIDVETVSPRKDIPNNLAVKTASGPFSKDIFWATQVRLLALKNFIDGLQMGRVFIARSQAKDFDSLLEYMKKSGVYTRKDISLEYDPVLVNGIIGATKYSIHSFDYDGLQNWTDKAMEKYKNLESQFKDILYDYRNSISGLSGEALVNQFISSSEYECMFNINIPKDDQYPSVEVDALWFRPEGIFVIETKNMNGTLEIDENMNVSSQTAGGVARFEDKDNPIVQCEKHCDRIKALFIKEGRQDLANGVKGIVVSINPKLKIKNKSDYPVVAASFLQNYIASLPAIEGLNGEGKDLIEKYASKDKRFKFHVLSIDSNPFTALNDEIDNVLAALAMDDYLYDRPLVLNKYSGMESGDLHMYVYAKPDVIETYFNGDKICMDPDYEAEAKKISEEYLAIENPTEEDEENTAEKRSLVQAKYRKLHYADNWYKISIREPDIIYK